MLTARTKRRELPAPEWVRLEGTGDIRLGEPLGWSGLLAFLQRVEHLIFLGRPDGVGAEGLGRRLTPGFPFVMWRMLFCRTKIRRRLTKYPC